MLTQNHPRHFRSFQYVYPVISRRSGGVSVGINLHSPCNFSCLYCQVLADSKRPKPELLNLDILEEELRTVLGMVQDGSLFEEDWFGQTPVDKRRLNDIALSGDGEPTLAEQFDDIVRLAAKVRASCSPPNTRLVLISNASRFHMKHVAETVDYLMQQGGEIWAKLDAGSAEYFQRIARTTVSYEQVLENILSVAIRHPIVIQTLLLGHEEREGGDEGGKGWKEGKKGAQDHWGVSSSELQMYVERLNHLQKRGGHIGAVQLYTIARNTPATGVRPLSDDEMEERANWVREKTGLTVQTYFSR